MRKPSEIRADLDRENQALDRAAAPIRDRIEALKSEKADQINHYGERIGAIRKAALGNGPLTVEQFVEWRNLLMEEAEDDRPAIIDAKCDELGV